MNAVCRRVVMVLGLSLLAGCPSGSPLVSLAPPSRPPQASEYSEIQSRWTRSARVIKALDTSLDVHATLFSPEFAAAYLARRSQMFRLTPADQAREERQLREETESGYTFFVTAASHDWNWIDFERPGSVWRLSLANANGEQVTPSQIRLERQVTATTMELFPQVADFHRVYTVRFPQALPDGRSLLRGDGQRLVLRFAGPLGHAELVWRFR